MKSHDTIDLIERNIQRKYNLLISIHLDPIVVNDAHINSLRDLTESAVKEIDPRFQYTISEWLRVPHTQI